MQNEHFIHADSHNGLLKKNCWRIAHLI